MSDKITIVFRDHVFRPPFLCMCCGKEVESSQWAYGRTCAICDTGACQPTSRAFDIQWGHGNPHWFDRDPNRSFQKYVQYVEATRK